MPSRPVVMGKNPANHVFVDWDVECQGDLLRDSRTAPVGITSFRRPRARVLRSVPSGRASDSDPGRTSMRYFWLVAELPQLRQRSALSVPPMASQSADIGGDRNQDRPLRSPVPSVRGKANRHPSPRVFGSHVVLDDGRSRTQAARFQNLLQQPSHPYLTGRANAGYVRVPNRKSPLISLATSLPIPISDTKGCLTFQRLGRTAVSGQPLQKPGLKSGVCVLGCSAFRGSDRFTTTVSIRQRLVLPAWIGPSSPCMLQLDDSESRLLLRCGRLILGFLKALSEPEWRGCCRTLWYPLRLLQNCRWRRGRESFGWPVLRPDLVAPCRWFV